MQTVKTFKTSDGELHEDKVEALQHEFSIELRGLVQSRHSPHKTSFSPSEIASFLSKNHSDVQKVISKYKTAIGRATPRATQKSVEKDGLRKVA